MDFPKRTRLAVGLEFERRVAAIYRALGAFVQQNVALAGNEIDIVTRERTPSGSELTSAIECKQYTSSIGVDVVNSYAAVVHLLKQRHLIDRAVLVASSGFTQQARQAASAHDIELLEFSDLEQRVQGKTRSIEQAGEAVDRTAQGPPSRTGGPRRLFVVMPFAPEFDDVYVLGIREVAERLGLVVERADSIEHNKDILTVIQERIRSCDGVIAVTTGMNPNVLYEVGYAHALERPTILISQRDSVVPSDLRSLNHIFYETLVQLRERLERRLRESFFA